MSDKIWGTSMQISLDLSNVLSYTHCFQWCFRAIMSCNDLSPICTGSELHVMKMPIRGYNQPKMMLNIHSYIIKGYCTDIAPRPLGPFPALGYQRMQACPLVSRPGTIFTNISAKPWIICCYKGPFKRVDEDTPQPLYCTFAGIKSTKQ